MIKPANIEEFKTLIEGMEHRERFVFLPSSKLKEKNRDIEGIEIYSTKLYEASTLMGIDTNVKVSFVDLHGKQLPGSANVINKYLRLWKSSFYQLVFDFIL